MSRADNFTTVMSRLSWNLRTSTCLEPSGPVQAYILPLLFHRFRDGNDKCIQNFGGNTWSKAIIWECLVQMGDNIKTDLREIENQGVNRIQVAQEGTISEILWTWNEIFKCRSYFNVNFNTFLRRSLVHSLMNKKLCKWHKWNFRYHKQRGILDQLRAYEFRRDYTQKEMDN